MSMAPRAAKSSPPSAPADLLAPGLPGESLADAAYRRVKSEILAMRLAPDDLVLAYEMAERFGISRTPMHEALKRLCHEGFLQVYPRVGYVVTPILASDVRDVFELRLLNEGMAAALAAERATERDLKVFQTLEDRQAEIRRTTSVSDEEAPVIYAAFNREYHLAIATMSGNRRLASLIGRLLDEGMRLFFLNSLDPTPHEMADPHGDVAKAIAAHDAGEARRIMMAHVAETQQRTLRSLGASVGST